MSTHSFKYWDTDDFDRNKGLNGVPGYSAPPPLRRVLAQSGGTVTVNMSQRKPDITLSARLPCPQNQKEERLVWSTPSDVRKGAQKVANMWCLRHCVFIEDTKPAFVRTGRQFDIRF